MPSFNANILSGSVRSRTPCSGGAVAEIGAVSVLQAVARPEDYDEGSFLLAITCHF
jgi:hypothetical protein